VNQVTCGIKQKIGLNMSKKTNRQNRILNQLEVNPRIRVNEMADDLDVSTETVRRDLAELDSAGRIQRTYGGAVSIKTFEPALAERSTLYVSAREDIARIAMEYVRSADSLFIGGGATTLHFARALRQIDKPLTILTPSFSIATELSANPKIMVMALPGVVEANEGLVVGGETLKCIEQYRTSMAIMGASGIDTQGVSEALINVAHVYSAMINNARETVILADSSKFGTRSLQQITDLNANVSIFTDMKPEPQIVEVIERNKAKLFICKDANILRQDAKNE
jgi:DeoR/GlpR family transcriptional regulator of sugar metabolism